VNTFIRWLKFNLVGAIGMVVQLAALALFNRWWAGRYLRASAAAVELTLLHNFVWHLFYTWRDRRDRSAILGRLLRFHLSNGLVSMLGNLALMRLLVHEAHMPLLVANSIAILCCSIVNFCLGNEWVFAMELQKESQVSEAERTPSKELPRICLGCLEISGKLMGMK
jgi:putative flippase GtrA